MFPRLPTLLTLLALAGTLRARCFVSLDSRAAKQGNFSSPGYPDPYPGGVLCHFHFRGREWEGVRLVFNHFDLQPPYHAGCLSDYVEILTVDVHNTQRFRGRYCGQDTPPPLLVLTPGVEVVFRSGQHVTHHRGFQGEYQFLDEETVTPPTPADDSSVRCGGVLSGTGGVLESPDFPASFPSGLDCVWLLRAAYNHHLYLRVSFLELHSNIADCRRAQLAVLDGYGPHDGSGKPLRTFCGDLKYYSGPDERALLSPRNRLLVRFTSARETASTAPAAPSKPPRTFGFRLVWTQIAFDTAENCTSRGQFVCRHSEFCVAEGSGGGGCAFRRFYCVAPSLVCDGQENCQEGDTSDETDCYVSLLVAASLAAPLALLLPAVLACLCHRKRARRKEAALLRAGEDPGTPLRTRDLQHSPSRSRPQHLAACSPDHFPTTLGLLSPASGFSDPADDDDSEFAAVRPLGNGFCPAHGLLPHSPLPSSSGSPRGSLGSDATCRLQSPAPSASPPTRFISPRPPRQRQAATMTSPPLGGYRVISPHFHPAPKPSPPTPRSFQSPQTPQRRVSALANSEEALCSTVTTFGVSAAHIPTMSQIATDV